MNKMKPTIIHKSFYLKHQYVDPTYCYVMQYSAATTYYANKNSRYEWKYVTCKKCLKYKRNKIK